MLRTIRLLFLSGICVLVPAAARAFTVDLVFAMGWSFDNVQAELTPGGAFAGLRHATTDEAWYILENKYGFDPLAGAGANAGATYNLIMEMGNPFVLGGPSITMTTLAFVADGTVFDIHHAFDQNPLNPSPFTGWIGNGGVFYPTSLSDTYVGHFLVDEAFAVPEPAVFALAAGLAAVGLAWWRRRTG